MRRAGREDRKRLASLVLVAVIAAFSLPLGAAAVTSSAAAPAPRQTHMRRVRVEAHPVASRRPLIERVAAIRSAPFVLAALALIGLVVLAGSIRPAWSPLLLPVQRGPPSSR